MNSSMKLLGIVVLLVLLLALVTQRLPTTREVRGKSSAVPLTNQMTPEQQLAQNLALSDARVQAHTLGHRSEVFGVRHVLADQYTAASRACATADCRQVEIYNFDENAAVTAIVNIETASVLDVLYLPGAHPGINKRLADLAVNIAANAPEVIEALGFKPREVNISAVDAGTVGSACDAGHLCVGPVFRLGERNLVAVVDLTEEELVAVFWGETGPDGSSVPFTPEDCPPTNGISVSRDGWLLTYATTNSDGLRVYDISYNGMTVATSIKLAEWHVDYDSFGFADSTGCSGGGGGFQIFPYGDTRVENLLDDQNAVIGFELIQDFRMSNWGASCNYRYEQHIQFFNDGRFRPAGLAYGKGCSTNALYRPVVRVDIAVDGDSNDTYALWDGTEWVDQATEFYRTPYDGSAGPHVYTAEGYIGRITDQSGAGYYLEPSRGQFGDGNRGDEPFVYVTQHNAAEGDADLYIIGSCCNDDHQQGPHLYVNNQAIAGENIVIWYVPQILTDVTPGQYYCWTLQGEPDPLTYPCWSGPMFVPVQSNNTPATAAFTHTTPLIAGKPVTFTNQSVGTLPINYEWSFGDGSPIVTDENPIHTYLAPGYYAVTLTATNDFGTHAHTEFVTVNHMAAAVAAFSHDGPGVVSQSVSFTNQSSGALPLSYSWDFGDGTGEPPITAVNPAHIYTAAGFYTVTLTASNTFGSSSSAVVLQIGHAKTTATPTDTASLLYTDGNDNTIHFHLPAGAVTETTTLLYTWHEAVTPWAPGLLFAGNAFALDAYREGEPLDTFTFAQPVTVSLEYSDTAIAGLVEATLQLKYWTGNEWADAATTCGDPPPTYEHDLEANRLTIAICHLTTFGLFGPGQDSLYLPLATKE